jgi:hydrogenase-1 operon protein HyaE
MAAQRELVVSSPLLERLTAELGYAAIDDGNHDAFVQQPGACVLFFAGDPQRFRDTTDVAVILPELVKQFPQLQPGVVTAKSEDVLQARYRFKKWPALVFLRDGAYLGAISGVQDWADYLQKIEQLLAGEPTRPSTFTIPVVKA